MKFYLSSLELSTLQTHIIVYRFENLYQSLFHIWICSVQIDFITIFRFERFYTIYASIRDLAELSNAGLKRSSHKILD